MKNTIKESQIRRLVKVLLEDKSLGPTLVKVNPVVDQSAALTDPQNPDFKPQSKPELKVALSAIIEDMPDDNIPDVYDSLKQTLADREEEEGKKQMKNSNDKIEESVRLIVRKMLREHFEKDPKTGELVWKGEGPGPKVSPNLQMKEVPPGVRGSTLTGPKSPDVKSLRSKLKAMNLDEPTTSQDLPEPGRKRKNVTVVTGGGGSLTQIAKELGTSVANVHKIVRDSQQKLKFAAGMDPEDYEVLLLSSVKDYIDQLSSSPDVTAADVQLLKSHPELVSDLPGFRDYFSAVVKSHMKQRD